MKQNDRLANKQASAVSAMLYIASHESLPLIGQTIRHAEGTERCFRIIETTVTMDLLTAARMAMKGTIDLPETAASRRTARVVRAGEVR